MAVSESSSEPGLRVGAVDRELGPQWLELIGRLFLGPAVTCAVFGVCVAVLRSRSDIGRRSESIRLVEISPNCLFRPFDSAETTIVNEPAQSGACGISINGTRRCRDEVASCSLDTEILVEEAYAALEPAERIPSHELRRRVARRAGQDGVLELDAAAFCRILQADGRFAVEPRLIVGLAGMAPRVNPFDATTGIDLPEDLDQAS